MEDSKKDPQSGSGRVCGDDHLLTRRPFRPFQVPRAEDHQERRRRDPLPPRGAARGVEGLHHDGGGAGQDRRLRAQGRDEN